MSQQSFMKFNFQTHLCIITFNLEFKCWYETTVDMVLAKGLMLLNLLSFLLINSVPIQLEILVLVAFPSRSIIQRFHSTP